MFRRAAAADVPALAALYAHAARTYGPRVYSPEQVAAWASFGADTAAFRDYVLGATTWLAGGDAPLGFCGIDAGGDVRSLYVQVGHGRQGLGRALLAHAMAQARATGVGAFTAWATPFSRPLFERAGFVLERIVHEPYQGVAFDRLRMVQPPTPAPR